MRIISYQHINSKFYLFIGMSIFFMLLDSVGYTQVEPKYLFTKKLNGFTNGLAPVQDEKTKLFGYMDKEGKVALSFKYENAYNFSDGLACVLIKGDYGFIDTMGNIKIPCNYKWSSYFENGAALVSVDEDNSQIIDKNGNVLLNSTDKYQITSSRIGNIAIIRDRKSGLKGLVNMSGGSIITCIYYLLDYCGNDGFIAVIQGNDKQTYGVVDKKGNTIIPFKNNAILEGGEGMLLFYNSEVKKFGVFDMTGEQITPFIYDEIEKYSEGLSKVRKDNKYGFIDKFGKIVVPIKYYDALNFSEGFSSVKLNHEDKYYSFIDKTGNIYDVKALRTYEFHDGLSQIYYDEINHYVGFINKDMKLVLSNDPKYNVNSQGSETYLSNINSIPKSNLKSTNTTNISSETENGQGKWVYSSNNNCKFFNQPWPVFETFSWSGNCENGYCSGTGKIVAYKADGSFSFSFEGSFTSGKPNGFGIQIFESGSRFEGYVLEGSYNGEGKQYDKNGNLKYSGNFSNDKHSGQGTYYFDNGDKYVGNFVDGSINGEGTYYFSGGGKYVGAFENGKFNGFGYQYDNDGKLSYEGYYKNDKIHGKGKLYSSKGYHIGNFIDGTANGYGELYKSNGNVAFKGYYKENKWNGEGTVYDDNGNIDYKGIWWDDKLLKKIDNTNDNASDEIENTVTILNSLNEQRTYSFPDGSKYVGNIVNNKFNGKGKYYLSDGFLRYDGIWKDDQINGQGTMYFKEGGEKVWGNFINGNLNGTASVYSKDGTWAYDGIWEDGKLQRKTRESVKSSNNDWIAPALLVAGGIAFINAIIKDNDNSTSNLNNSSTNSSSFSSTKSTSSNLSPDSPCWEYKGDSKVKYNSVEYPAKIYRDLVHNKDICIFYFPGDDDEKAGYYDSNSIGGDLFSGDYLVGRFTSEYELLINITICPIPNRKNSLRYWNSIH